MSPALMEFCDTCKSRTRRCEYYQPGRSRQHNRCLECDRNDPRIYERDRSTDPRYCSECDRNRRTERL